MSAVREGDGWFGVPSETMFVLRARIGPNIHYWCSPARTSPNVIEAAVFRSYEDCESQLRAMTIEKGVELDVCTFHGAIKDFMKGNQHK